MREEITVVIKRNNKEPIGLNITGGQELDAGAIYVHSTREDGPCAGLLLDHDMVVSINGKTLGETAKRSDAVEIVESSSGDLTFGVLREPHSGFLIKQGMKNKNWKKRLFVINGRELSYYPPQQHSNRDLPYAREVPSLGKCLGTIHLNNVTSIEDFSLYSKKDMFGFQLVTPHRTYFLFAETSKEKQLWIDALKPHIGGPGQPAGGAGQSPASEGIGDDFSDDDDDAPSRSASGSSTKDDISRSRSSSGTAECATAELDEMSITSGVTTTSKNDEEAGEDVLLETEKAAATVRGYTGFILKSSPDYKSWKRRFFVLKDKELTYFKTSDAKGKPQGSISLSGDCSIIAYQGPNAKGHPHAFDLTVVGGRHYVCSCASNEERDEWIKRIKKEMA